MKNFKLAFVDLETTGLNPVIHEIIEVGCLIAKPVEGKSKPTWEIVDELELKVKPTHLETAEPEALRINNYNEGDWLFAVSLQQAMETLVDKMGDSMVVGQNVTFDWSFLVQAFNTTQVWPNTHYHVLDLASMAYGKLFQRADFQKFSLKAMCDYFGVKNTAAHSALADTRATFEVFQKLLAL